MLYYTFAELFTAFYYLQPNGENRKTQEELAIALNVSRRTITNWFSGRYTPRTPEFVERVAYLLCLNTTQTDLLLYSIKPDWVKYGTPSRVLEAVEIVRYAEREVSLPKYAAKALPSITQIEEEWTRIVHDTFESNYRKWGVGSKQNGICSLERQIGHGTYTLSLQNQYHEEYPFISRPIEPSKSKQSLPNWCVRR